MGLLTASLSTKTHLGNKFPLSSGKLCREPVSAYNLALQVKLDSEGYGSRIVAFSSRKSAKKLRRNKEQENEVILPTGDGSLDDYSGKSAVSEASSVSNVVPSRRAVLQACSLTSGLLAALGLAIRQVSPVASAAGLPVFDCSQVSFGLEVWDLELITGLVVLISVSRYTLLKTWAEFAESSEAANTQVLTSLQTFDYLVVAFLPGITEELLFRGALLPLLGLNWTSALAVAALFGVLHLGSGRKISFAIWATFVGAAYGYGTIVSSSVVVPMAAHALNNLIGAVLWRQTSRSSEQISS